MTVPALLEMRNIVKKFGTIIALNDVSFALEAGEVHCLLGDNGAGKSTMIQLIAGVHQPNGGEIWIDGKRVVLASPSDALDRGIATVYQDLGLVPLLSITRNFFMGREPVADLGLLKIFKLADADRVARDEMHKIGIEIRDPTQPVGTLSGGERQSLAIARAVYFGAKVLTLDEPTSALGVAQTMIVLRYIDQLRKRGIGVIFISHNVHHAHAVGDRFTVLNRGRAVGIYRKSQIAVNELQALMAGGRELQGLTAQLRAN
jgi:simple sugar transport system ATP-binding protein